MIISTLVTQATSKDFNPKVDIPLIGTGATTPLWIQELVSYSPLIAFLFSLMMLVLATLRVYATIDELMYRSKQRKAQEHETQGDADANTGGED